MSDSFDLKRDCAERTIAARSDTRTTAELISSALSATEDGRWNFVVLLHFRATRDVLDAAQSLCASECLEERILGADILGQLGIPDRAFPDECLAILLPLLDEQQDPDLLQAACIALGHLHDTRCVEPLSRLRNHPDVEVRLSVTMSLGVLEDDRAIDTLIELTEDEDEDVRDWATFGLGTQTDRDTPAIRAALLRRIHDTDPTVIGEALVGLARRKDARILDVLIARLEPQHLATLDREHRFDFEVDAAEELADPRLLPVLRRVQEQMGDEIDVEDAIRACQGAEGSA
jgi:HEAT repeat protein